MWIAVFLLQHMHIPQSQADQSWDMGHQAVAKSAAQSAKKWGIAAVLTGVYIILTSIEVILRYAYGGPYT